MSDTVFMRHALSLAGQPVRSPSPNPRVGAVIVRDGAIVGRGFHEGPGLQHAEEMAVREAGDAARGATLYCTLEPCSHSGPGKHRPPCAPLIVKSGIRRVVVAHLDTNPQVCGNGVALLAGAGLEVSTGIEADAAIEINAGFNTWMALRRPYVHLKVAQSLDGRLAAADGSSSWITDEQARAHAQSERGQCDAVVVGIRTVLADDPLLTVRYGPKRSPVAVVFDSHARLPLSSRLVGERPGETILVTTAHAPHDQVEALKRVGVTVLCVDGGADGLEIADALRQLAAHGVRSLYVEGGRTLIASFLAAGLYDRLTCYVAPLLIGGPNVAIEPSQAASIEDAVRLERARSEVIADQALLTGFRPGWWSAVYEAMKEATYVHRTD